MSIGIETPASGVVGFDPDRDLGEAQDLRIGNAELLSFGVRHIARERRMAAPALAVDHADLLGSEPAPQHPAISLAERGLVDVEFIWIDLALHDGFAETVAAGDKDHVTKAGFGIEREDDTAGRQIGVDHFHHGDRKRDLEMIEAVVDAIGNRAIGENGGKAAPASFEQVFGPAHIKKAFVLACKTRRRQVLGGRRAPYGDGNAGPGLAFKLPIGFYGLLAQQRRVHRLVYDLAGLSGLAREVLDLALVDPIEKPVKLVRHTAPQ
ncbi:hypothetical protein ABIF70_003616 [Bradyrhizobium japonicum]